MKMESGNFLPAYPGRGPTHAIVLDEGNEHTALKSCLCARS